MVPLQAEEIIVRTCSSLTFYSRVKNQRQGKKRHTELLLDDLQNLLLVKLLWKTLNCSQSLTTIALCSKFG